MRVLIGHIFTEGPIKLLKECGLHLQKDDSKTEKGYNTFYCFLNAGETKQIRLEIREVLDENLYLQSEEKKDFKPFEMELDFKSVSSEQSNLNFKFIQLLTEATCDGDIKNYFQIKKKYSMWGIQLKSENFQLRKELINPSKTFTVNGDEIVVIHLGESCFDFAIS